MQPGSHGWRLAVALAGHKVAAVSIPVTQPHTIGLMGAKPYLEGYFQNGSYVKSRQFEDSRCDMGFGVEVQGIFVISGIKHGLVTKQGSLEIGGPINNKSISSSPPLEETRAFFRRFASGLGLS